MTDFNSLTSSVSARFAVLLLCALCYHNSETNKLATLHYQQSDVRWPYSISLSNTEI